MPTMEALKHVFLEGKSIYLRALEEKDANGNYFQWLNDEEVCRNNSHAIFPNSELKTMDYIKYAQSTGNAVILAIIDKATDQHIGNISLQNINWVSRNAEFAILLGDKNFWNKGYSSDAAMLLCNHGFKKLNLFRIYCGTFATNAAMIKLAEKLKMQQEGIRRKAIFKDGKYTDIIEFGVLADEFYN